MIFSHQEIAEVTIDVVTASCFVGMFYLTLCKDMEEKAIERNVDLIIKSLIPPINLPNAEIKNKVRSLLSKDIDEKDDIAIEKSNSKLTQKTIKAFSILLVAGVLLTFFIVMHGKQKNDVVNLKNLLIHCSVMLAVVAATEYMFFSIVLGKTIFVDSRDVLSIAMDQ